MRRDRLSRPLAGRWVAFPLLFVWLLLVGCSGSDQTGSPGQLVSLGVTPRSATLAPGATLQLTAMGTYGDGAVREHTSQVAWTSSNSAAATVSSTGLVTAVAVGTSEIAASLNGVSAQATLTVSAPALMAIAVTPRDPSIAQGTTRAFVATGTFADASTQDLTTQVTWMSSLPAIATVTSQGLATGLAVGQTTLSATLAGKSGSTTLTVSAAATLNLIAGALGGRGSADDTGAVARFDIPHGMALDGAGNLYVADYGSHTIRKVVVATGAASTIAGTAGQVGSTDDMGAAARFNFPRGLVLDGAATLYVADTSSHTIRKVDLASGTVTTLAGTAGMRGSTNGMGAAARFYDPYGLAADGLGNLYVADSGNHTLRKIILATGVVSTIAGLPGTSGSANGTGNMARFNYPKGLALDGSGGLYVADSANHAIRRLLLGSDSVSTFVGTAGMRGSADGNSTLARFSDPSGLSVDAVGNLYVADYSNHTIRRVDLSTRDVSTLAGTAGMFGGTDGTGSAARFYYPDGLAVDSGGTLYVADTYGPSIRKVVVGMRAVSTLAGATSRAGSADGPGASARFTDPRGAALDGLGNLYVADSSNHTIRKIVLATGAVSILAGAVGMRGSTDDTGAAARFNYPAGLAADGAGNLYVTETSSFTIRKIDLSTGAVSTVAGSAGMVGSANGMGAAARFNIPYGVAVDGAGSTLYVADTFNNTIRKIDLATRDVSTLAGVATLRGSLDGIGAAARFDSPFGVAVDGAGGALYVADTYNHTVRKIDLTTREVSTLAGFAGMRGSADGSGPNARFDTPNGVSVDGAGTLYVADTGNHTLRKIVLATRDVTTLVGRAGQSGVKLGPLPARLNGPAAIATAPAGRLYITDSVENAVLEVR